MGPHPCVAMGSVHGSAHTSQLGRGLQRWVGNAAVPAVGPLTSFQSLPFINIYSSSSTKNNILELREQEENEENQCEWDEVITCSQDPRMHEQHPGSAPPGCQSQLST